MKKLLLVLFGVLFLTLQAKANFTEEVNQKEVFKNKFYILDNEGKVKYLTESEIQKMWEASSSEEGYGVKLTKFEIISSKDEENGQTYYFLKAISSDGTIETGAFFTKTKYGMLIGEKKCTCVGCASGCSLSIFGSNCSCSACGYGGSQECKKTEEMTIKTFDGSSSNPSLDTGI